MCGSAFFTLLKLLGVDLPNFAMKTKEEQRAEIQFCLREGRSPTETFDRLRAVHGQNCLSRAAVFRWHKELREGRGLKDRPHPHQPRKVTDAKVREVSRVLDTNRRSSIATLARRTNISVGSVHKVLHQKLHMRKAPAQWIPHLLNDAQKARRVERARQALQMMRRRAGPTHLICGDESWFRCWDPEDKRSSMQWIKPGESRPQKVRVPRTTIKVMLIIFFDNIGVVHREFIPDRVGITKELYHGVIQNLIQSVNAKRPQVRRNWLLLHDNAGAHIARIVTDVLDAEGVEVVPHPGYSPDLSPPDFWLFNKLKRMTNGVIYHNVDDLKTALDAAMANIPQAEFAHAMDDSYPECLRKCIASGGSYFE